MRFRAELEQIEEVELEAVSQAPHHAHVGVDQLAGEDGCRRSRLADLLQQLAPGNSPLRDLVGVDSEPLGLGRVGGEPVQGSE